MNKYEFVFDMLKNKILFLFKRYNYNNSKILTLKNLSFLSIISFIIIIRFFKFIIKNDSNENNFNMNYSEDVSNNKRSTLTFKTFKEKRFKNLILSTLPKLTH